VIPIHTAATKIEINQLRYLTDDTGETRKASNVSMSSNTNMLTSCVFKSCNVLCNCSCLGFDALEVLGERSLLEKMLLMTLRSPKWKKKL